MNLKTCLKALEDALNVARDNQDDECVNEVLSWLRFLQGMESVQANRYPLYIINENTTSNTNVIFLEAISKLAIAREMLHKVT